MVKLQTRKTAQHFLAQRLYVVGGEQVLPLPVGPFPENLPLAVDTPQGRVHDVSCVGAALLYSTIGGGV